MTRPHSWEDLPGPDPSITTNLLGWFEENGRRFAWRETEDPFHVLGAELMLQRTRADQVEPVYREFCTRFSTPQDVIDAGPEVVKGLFGRLGLLWRVEYFWKLQKELAREHGGTVPEEYDLLTDLPGVGQYAASAVRVFAHGERHTVVDSNVLRLFGRYYGIEFPDHARRSPRVHHWATEHAPEADDRIREFNWALIDFAATICTPRSPDCDSCPLRRGCWYFTHQY